LGARPAEQGVPQGAAGSRACLPQIERCGWTARETPQTNAAASLATNRRRAINWRRLRLRSSIWIRAVRPLPGRSRTSRRASDVVGRADSTRRRDAAARGAVLSIAPLVSQRGRCARVDEDRVARWNWPELQVGEFCNGRLKLEGKACTWWIIGMNFPRLSY